MNASKQSAERKPTHQPDAPNSRELPDQDTASLPGGRTAALRPLFGGADSVPNRAALLQRLHPAQHNQVILALQRTAGNAAVAQQLRGRDGNASGRAAAAPAEYSASTTDPTRANADIGAAAPQSRIQRIDETIRYPGSTVTFNPHAWLTLQGAQRQDDWFPQNPNVKEAYFLLRPGATGMIYLNVWAFWRLVTPVGAQLGQGTGWVEVYVPFRVTAEGQFRPEAPRRNGEGTGGGARLELAGDPIVDPTEDGGTLIMTPKVISEQSTVYQLGHVGPTAPNPLTWERSYAVNVRVNRGMLTPNFLRFERVHFETDEDRYDDQAELTIRRLLDGLPSDVRDGIRTGSTQIKLDGYCSATGNITHNTDLSYRRGRQVRQLIARLMALTNQEAERIRIVPHGRVNAQLPGERREERRVQITIEAAHSDASPSGS